MWKPPSTAPTTTNFDEFQVDQYNEGVVNSPAVDSGASLLWNDSAGRKPIAHDGTVYYLRPSNDEVVAADGATGTADWVYSSPTAIINEVNTWPAYHDGHLYVFAVNPNSGGGDYIRKLDPADGSLVSEIGIPLLPPKSPITITTGDVLVAGGQQDGVGDSIDNHIAAVDLSSESTLWKRENPPEAIRNLTVAAGKVFAPIAGDIIYTYDLQDGSTLWERQISDMTDMGISPVYDSAAGNVIIANSTSVGHTLYALDAADGSTVWSDTTAAKGSYQEGLCLYDGYLYYPEEDAILKYDVSDGSLVWETTLSGSGFVRAAPVYSAQSGRLYVGTEDAVYHALDPSDGTELFTFSTTGSFRTHTLASGRVFYTDPYDGNGVVAYE